MVFSIALNLNGQSIIHMRKDLYLQNLGESMLSEDMPQVNKDALHVSCVLQLAQLEPSQSRANLDLMAPEEQLDTILI